MSDLHRCKNPLREDQKMAEAYVEDAQRWADFLIKSEYRGPGDTLDAAMARCERKYRVSRSVLWSLRYRTPKDMLVSVYMALRDAYETELSKLDRRIENELRKAELIGPDATNSKAYRFARAALGEPEART
ncbi:MAG: hypothetical protein K5872_22100 [Rhizobiaceae bacterium]|nr:hypothetical protein [Rhizobiaceae bacterium]MCV0408913.1 hypothetical protein [Rhizobiaceae bacterium]